MKALIGQRLIKSLQPQSKPYEIRDTRQDGFILRVQPSGSMSYICEYTRGKRITIAKVTAIKPEQARDRAGEIIAQAKGGKDPIQEKRKEQAGTLRDYIEKKYGPWVEANRKTGAATVARIKTCFKDLLKFQLADLTAWQLEKWKTARLKAGKKAATVNRDLTALKAALSKAMEWGMLNAHPLAKVKPAKVDRSKKVRFLDPAEEKRLRQALEDRNEVMRKERDSANQWRSDRGYQPLPSLRDVAYPDHMTPMVLLSINTGIRRGEMFSMTWQNVDLQRAMLTIEGDNAKSGSTRHVPLNDEALTVLKKWREQTNGTTLVFPGKKGQPMDNIKKAWSGIVKAAKLQNFRWHDLRHHFASRLVMAGVVLNTVRDLLGHADIKMTLRYAHLAPEHKAAAVAKLLNFKQENLDQSNQTA
jgi:integrase